MDLKNKLRAIVVNNCDNEIKIELLDDLMMHVANEYAEWFVARDDLLVQALGLVGFIDDCTLSKEEIWLRFKEYNKIKPSC